MTFELLDIDLIWDWQAKELGIAYLPGLEAVGTPLLLDEGHVGVKVVVHLEVGTLLVDDCDVVSIDVRVPRVICRPYRWWLRASLRL
jgi:hypothetical protein